MPKTTTPKKTPQQVVTVEALVAQVLAHTIVSKDSRSLRPGGDSGKVHQLCEKGSVMYFCESPGPIDDSPHKNKRKRMVNQVHDHCKNLPGHDLEI